MKYFEVRRPSGDGLCSDNNCPCYPEVKIPRGSGYLYVSQKTVDLRRDIPTIEEWKRKLESFHDSRDFQVTAIIRTASAILMCEEGAKLRGIDLEIAAADANHWWKTGLVPLRATPYKQSSE